LPTIKSIAQLLNLRLSPESLQSKEGLNWLAALLKGFRNLKLWHVAGYSALFVTLDRATQDDIIRRTSCDLN
jgi:pyruvate-formate lyase